MLRKINVFFIPVGIGVVAVFVCRLINNPLIDTLVLSMVLGMVFRLIVDVSNDTKKFFLSMSVSLILMGIILYGALNLNFQKTAGQDPVLVFLLLFVFLIYLIALLFLSGLLKLPSKVAYLITAGSAVCGASAIAITSRAIDADPDEVSVSLLAVFCAALLGIFCTLPACCFFWHIDKHFFASMAGIVLQFTGFVRTAVAGLPADLQNLALGLKSIRYLALVLVIPLFASFEKKVFFFPGYLIAFIFAGGFFSVVTQYNAILFPIFKDVLDVLWAVAMVSIGLCVDIKHMDIFLFLKTFCVSFVSFCIAVVVYIIGYSILFTL